MELVGGFVIAGLPARFAVHEAIVADADIELGLAEAAELIALALVFRHFALRAAVFAVGGSGGHRNKVARSCGVGERDGGNFELLIVTVDFCLKNLAIPRTEFNRQLTINNQQSTISNFS